MVQGASAAAFVGVTAAIAIFSAWKKKASKSKKSDGSAGSHSPGRVRSMDGSFLRHQPSFKGFANANFPTDEEGRVYHLFCKRGDVANRILTVGDAHRAERISKSFDNPSKTHIVKAPRGFTIYTGLYKGTPVSIVATGMGFPNMDFVVRETRAVVDGPMAFIRFGTCGTLRADCPIGSIAVATNCRFIARNPDGWSDAAVDKYTISQPVHTDAKITQSIINALEERLDGEAEVVPGTNCTACSFYSSQGRTSDMFDDANEDLINRVVDNVTDAHTLEMETFHMVDLARCSNGSVVAGAATIVLANRIHNDFLPKDQIVKLEHAAGPAMLDALVACEIEEKGELHKGGVWEQ